MAILNHIHTYERVRKQKNRYRCVHPDCTHFNVKELLVGNRAICILCNGEFILDNYSLTLRRPRCENCRQIKRKQLNPQITVDILRELGL